MCATSGLKATPHCPDRRTVRVAVSQAPTVECPHHRLLPIDVRNGLLAGDKCPPRFVGYHPFEVLPPRYAEWQVEHSRRAPPTAYSPLCPAKGPVPGAVVITWPRPHEVFLVEPGYDARTQSVELLAEVEPRLPQVTWLVDGAKVAQAAWPYKARWPLAKGRHRLEATSLALRSEPVEFEVR